MAQLLAFAGSNSSTSINFKLVKYTAELVQNQEVQVFNLANYPFPMYSIDIETKEGYSNSLVEFKEDIQKADGLIISVNEHNGSPSAYFKNVLDWLSRLERKFMQDKKVLLMATSPGKRGGIGALELVENLLPRFGADVVATFSLPSFNENFGSDGISDAELAAAHQQALQLFLDSLT